MGDSSDSAEVAGAARSLIASARELLREFMQEGVDEFDPHVVKNSIADAVDAPTPAPTSVPPPTPRGSAGEATRQPPEVPAATGIASAPPATPTPPPGSDSLRTLAEVRAELGECTRCGLCEGRQNIVFGAGDPHARLMFIGEGPGENEDLQGIPFVGRAGDLLTQMIEKGMGVPRSDVYICNIVKCRPPNNRNPLPPEVAACRPFLDAQIEAVKPNVIVTLGKPAASLLLDREIAITRERGTWHEYRGIPLMPTLHPAYILRQYTAENRRAVWQDLKAALARSEE